MNEILARKYFRFIEFKNAWLTKSWENTFAGNSSFFRNKGHLNPVERDLLFLARDVSGVYPLSVNDD
jgi:hypothetical protein